MHGNERSDLYLNGIGNDRLEDIYSNEEEEDHDTLQPIPENPAVAVGEYWRGLSTLPQGYSTPHHNVPSQPATPRSRWQGVALPRVPNPPLPQVLHPPFTQIPPAPSRWWRRGPSSSGHVAYVLFGGLGDEPGLYYNWDSLALVLARYQANHAPAYMGWDTEERAIADHNQYETTGEIPYKLRIRGDIILVNGSVVGVNPPALRATTRALPVASQAVTPQRTQSAPVPSPQPASPLSPTPTRRRAKPVVHVSPVVVSPAAADGDRLYYVVLAGHAPGVYNTLFEAVRAAGVSMGVNILTASTRAAANQMFVDGFMTGRVVSSGRE